MTMTACFAALLLSVATSAAGQAPAGQPPAPAPAKPKAARPAPTRSTVSVRVTDQSGNPIAGVKILVAGTVARDGVTAADGTASFANVAAGTYRVRFERDGFITFEREISVRAGRPLQIDAALSAAPPPPKPPPPPESQRVPSVAARGEPKSISVPEFVESTLTGKNAPREATVGCLAGGTASVMQVRDPVAEHTHADADEILYVVAGEGVHAIGGSERPVVAGMLLIVPRGTSHSLRRSARPIVLISILAGPPCTSPDGSGPRH